ncbi:hypothetical protein N7519_009981 [Penicillium mononematosum]|uniref:uncharacterized protein n=1 Tax=Penicillium mononematosum TaxID=268346 RepID=UPI0025485AFE|nr:uncharacterized protein N7519_009981 [Penicillium mononematosum]KAJ6179520.1 hypothetical protein N7519_009981 [Penicillium mononematosum]
MKGRLEITLRSMGPLMRRGSLGNSKSGINKETIFLAWAMLWRCCDNVTFWALCQTPKTRGEGPVEHQPSFGHDIPDPTPSTVLNDWFANLEKRYRVWAEQSPQRTAARQYQYHTSRNNNNTLPWRRQYPYPAKGKAFELDPKNIPIVTI